ncbi:hypothetical protein CJ030_MR1G014036 [Morella rubra]|uniref:Uncharacterized protein n=1 Tax=Morella rubra TaxID=262757 RepID=A0A6A1WP21_9ROSI|nr:hypothetical protein CJ030_MR5G002484 [Morella rubra]KAB1226306.1 hypothetical protein CJ030_MR1G014036 [Morella rubra]
MNHAIRSTRTYPPTLFSAPVSYNAGRKAPKVSFKKVTTMASGQADSKSSKDNTQNPNENTGDVMSHSFGEGYATRSDEEGFGGIYGGNQSLPQTEQHQQSTVHGNHPDYDKSQGSEVKEKEKARHQTSAK